MLIPETLFDCIKNSRGLECFPVINMHGIRISRYHKNKTPEQKKAFSKTMSKTMKKVRRKYMDNITPAQEKAFAERMRKGSKKYWKNVSEEDKKIHTSLMSKGMKKAWEEGRVDIGTPEQIRARVHKVGSIEENLPRINDYSGVISMSDLESL